MSEEISFGDRLQIHFLEMNNSEAHTVLGPVYAHLVGCVGVPCGRVADAVKSAFEGLTDIFGTLLWSPVLGAINLVRRVKYQKEAYPNRFSASRGVKSLGLAFIYMLQVPKDFATNLIYPKWNESKKEPPKVDPKKKEPPENDPPHPGDGEPTGKVPPTHPEPPAIPPARPELELELELPAPPQPVPPEPPAAPELAIQPTVPDPSQARGFLADIQSIGREGSSVNLRTPTPSTEPKKPDGIQGSFHSRVEDVVSSIHENQDPTQIKAAAVDTFRSTIAFEDPADLTPQNIQQRAAEVASDQGIDPSVLASAVWTLEQIGKLHSDNPEDAQNKMVEHLEQKLLVETPTPNRIFTPPPAVESMAERIDRERREQESLLSNPPAAQPGAQPSPDPAPNPWGSLRRTEQGSRLIGL